MHDEMTPCTDSGTPKVITWFKVYAAFLCVMYLVVAALSLIFFLVDPVYLDMPELAARFVGVGILVIGLGLLALCLVPLLVSPRPWLWTYDLLIICLGMTSACFLPACIPLLIYWIKPETKAHFGRR